MTTMLDSPLSALPEFSARVQQPTEAPANLVQDAQGAHNDNSLDADVSTFKQDAIEDQEPLVDEVQKRVPDDDESGDESASRARMDMNEKAVAAESIDSGYDDAQENVPHNDISSTTDNDSNTEQDAEDATSGNARRTSTAAATTPTGPDERDVDEGSLVSASENHTNSRGEASFDLLSELSYPFKPMEPLPASHSDPGTPSTIIPILPQLQLTVLKESDSVSHAELSPISILRSPFDFSPKLVNKAHLASDGDANTVSTHPPPMLAQPQPQVHPANIPILSLNIPDLVSPPPRRSSMYQNPVIPASLQPARISQRRHSSANVLSPIEDSPQPENILDAAGAQLVPVYHPELRRFSLMDGGPQVASARLGLARRTSGGGNATVDSYTDTPARPPMQSLPRAHSSADLTTLSTIPEPSSEEYAAFPSGPAGDVTLSLDPALVAARRMSRPASRIRATQRSQSAGTTDAPALEDDGDLLPPVPRFRQHLRSEAERTELQARRQTVARWSTFEEMGIQSYALAEKKGDKTVDSKSRKQALAKMEARERERESLKKRGRRSVVMSSLGSKGLSRPSSSREGSMTGTGSGAPSVSDASMERNERDGLAAPPGLGFLRNASRNASMPTLANANTTPPELRASSSIPNTPPIETASLREPSEKKNSKSRHVKKNKSAQKPDKDKDRCIIM